MKRIFFAALLLAACGDDKPGPGADGGAGAGGQAVSGWTRVAFDPLPARPALGIFGFGERDVYFVGGGIGTGRGALALHYDGAWSELPVDVEETLWWVWGSSPQDLWFVGEKGIALHWDGVRVDPMRVGTEATLFGVWGCAPSDVWAVGGSPTTSGDNDLLFHYDGTSWQKVAPPEALGVAYLKIWGSSCHDIFVVGRQGVIVHYDGQAWARMDSATSASLTTVSGSGPSDVYAVGGPPAAVVHYDGQRWTALPDFGWESAAVSGVSVDPDGTAWLVGWSGEAWRRKDGVMQNDTAPDLIDDLHVVWSDGHGNAFAGGGGFLAPASPSLVRRGAIARFGTGVAGGKLSRP